METSAFLAGFFLLISFAVRDLYLNSEPSSETSTDRTREREGVVDKVDLGESNEKKDDFFSDDDQDDNFKSGLPGVDMSTLGPGSRISSAKFSGPTVRFLYCSASGYRSAYDQFVTIIQDKRPELFVEGSTYPPTNFGRIGAQIINIIKFLVIGSVLVRQYSFMHFIGIPVGVTNWMTQNKVYTGLLCFFFCNFMESQLVATGAFEIYFDDVPIWSKLQTGRVPAPPELMQIIDNQLKMGGRESVMDGFKI